MPSRYLTIGRIAKPQGIRGEVVVTIDTDFPSRFFEADHFLLRKPGQEPREYPVDHVRPHKDRVVIKFQHCDSRNDAEKLRDMEIVIPEEDRITDDENFFYYDELENMVVLDENGNTVGKVQSVLMVPGRDVLVVRDCNREILIPFAEHICYEVDRETRTIRVRMPEGLESINQG